MIDVETFAAAKAYTDSQGGGSGDGDMKKSVYDSDLAVSGAGGINAFVNNAVANKVDKVEGKGLSTNDYSDTEKGKVAANASAIAGIKNGTSINSFGDVESAISSLRMKYINRYANSVPMSIIETGKTYMFIARLLNDNYYVSSGVAIVTTWRGNATQTLSTIGGSVTWSNSDNKYSPTSGGNIWGIEIDVYEL